MEKKSNHQVKVVRVKEVLKHTNADKLEIIQIDGYQVVVGKDQFKAGDLAVYIQPDSIVPQTEPFRFIWENYITEPIGDVPVRRRRITVKKLRGQYSEGLLMPITDFLELPAEYHAEGLDVSDLIGITHYDPDADKVEVTRGLNEAGPGGVRRFPKSLKGWFYWIAYKLGFNLNGNVQGWDREKGVNLPYYDIDAFKNFTKAFVEGEMVLVTEKIHGSNARFVYFNGKMYAGSRTLWKSVKSRCIWRRVLDAQPWIEVWCKENEGYALYGEVVPTQGDVFTYGAKPDAPNFFVFDVRTPKQEWAQYHYEMEDADGWAEQVYFDGDRALKIPKDQHVPVLYLGPFNVETIKSLVDGSTQVASSEASHIQEGVVVKAVPERHVVGLGRAILKLVSNTFLEESH